MPQGDRPVLETGLSIRGVTKRYGPITVLRDVDLDVRPGEVVALLGENGAGKSTVSSVIAGLTPATAGTMTWNGKPYAPTGPADALQHGIGLIHQEMRLLPDLSIAENVFVGRLPTRNGRVDRAAMARRAAENLHALGLDISPATLVRDLRVAAQQRVEIAKALTLNARFLIFDEPTAALGGEETDHLFEQIGRLKRGGMGFIYISHRLDEIARIADRVVVLRDGQMVGSYETAQVPVKTLVEAMVGRPLDRMFPAIVPADGRDMLAVTNLSSPDGTFADVSFTVKAGEIFGIAGIVGAGRTELMRAIAGADPIASGTIAVDGVALSPRSPADSLKAGIVLVPEDRKGQGLVLEHTIGDNIALGNYPRLAPSGFVRPSAVRRFADVNIRRFGIKGRAGQPANHLSGGNQQKVVLAKNIAREPRIVILDEPTRGIDVGAKYEIYSIINALADEGKGVLMISSEMPELLGMCDRIYVMNEGRFVGEFPGNEATQEKIMRAIMRSKELN